VDNGHMPMTPPTQCSKYRCKQPSTKGSAFCLEHSPPKTTTQDRQRFNAHYKTAAWQIQRNIQLSKQPLCQACLLNNQITQAEHIDHLFAWSALGEYAFKLNIFQSLCESHHSFKTGLESKGIFRHYTANNEIDYSLSDYHSVVTSR
jgi:5-methylcytosine-specific restriction endonuclease McrA